MKRFSAPPLSTPTQYPDPSKPPTGEAEDEASLSDGSKKVKTAQSFESLFDNETLSDVVLNVNNSQFIFHAHKMILGMKSDVLATLLNNMAIVEGQKPVLFIQEPQECCLVFSRFLYFIYSGAVWLHRDYVIPLYKLAEKYAVRSLSSHCESYIHQLLQNGVGANGESTRAGFAVETVCDLCENNTSSEEIHNISYSILCSRFKELARSERWIQCSWEIVRDLIKSDECNSEENLILTAATDWMKKNNLHSKCQIEDILSNIRYPLLNRRVLYHLQKNSAFKNFPCVQDLVNTAIKYHAFKDIPEAKDDFTGVQFQRRSGRQTSSIPASATASSLASETDCNLVQTYGQAFPPAPQ
ncbi:BTB/POZ domain-containing protein 17-like [Haliotis cracherodii]|uniref:BTB/POZ domain-containing protein 17-like n=1 Tax=Haliotis cracherodii TaxID=6455 RepID=UPI0039E8573F